MNDKQKQFVNLLSKFSVGMFTTVSTSGGLHTRPMAVAEVTPDGDLFLLTDKRSEKVAELDENSGVAFSCQDSSGRYVTLSGIATLTNDSSKVKEIWKGEFDAWFPNGFSQALLIHVKPHTGEFWDMSGLAKATYMYEMIKAQFSDQRPDMEQYHGQV